MPRESFSLNNLPNWMRGRFNDGQRFLMLCICAGVLCGLVGVSFHLAITFTFENMFALYEGLGFWTIPAMIFSPALAGLLVGLMIRYVSPTASGSGIPQTKAAYYQNFGIIKTPEAFWRFIIGTISVGFGNSLGREGPTVHICSAISSKLGRIFGLGKLRIQSMVPVGMGAGISAAFNAPISAITFVFEELFDNNFSSKALGGILIAVVVAAVVERSLIGDHSALHATREVFETSWWMLVCLAIGPAAGLLGHLFVSLLLGLRAQFKQATKIPSWARPALGGLSVGLIGVTVWQFSGGHNGVFSIGYDDLNSTLHGHLIWQVLLLLLVGKFLATAVCYASGASGGIFAPVLFIGSMLGGLFGVLMVKFLGVDQSVAAATALLGTGAFFAAVIRCPLTSVLIIFEMTQNYSLILPLMIGNLIAYIIAGKLRSIPIYDALLLQDGISLKKLPAYRGDRDWRNLPVSTIMTHDCRSAFGELDAKANLERIAQDGHKHHAYTIVSNENRQELLGMITHHELEELQAAEDRRSIGEWVAGHSIIEIHPDDSIRDAANTLVIRDVMQAPVVSRKDTRKLLGIVTLHDIARQQNAIEDSMD
ncbi:chloride channel protein [Coraliomargarita algicola]|uniref:Chloride channel protein n=1 Tax=Coraliomargarita algicola TaxID=3092156 RepID=A0ABZ0RHH1_9BACT|nr:chloride channel protein [Coraliomargarita sp. J2-16]WPJ95639.1 chloride channel protein [Coraliomargarita sp. J2-16]